MSRIEHGDHARKHCIETGARVERVNREPGLVDADHFNHLHNHAAHWAIQPRLMSAN